MNRSHRAIRLSPGAFRPNLGAIFLSLCAIVLAAGPVMALDGSFTAWVNISPDWTTSVAPTQLGLDPTNPDRIFVGTFGEGLYYTEDGGQNWTQNYDDFFIEQGVATDIVRDIAFNPADPDEGAALTMSGSYHTNDAGESWTRDPGNDNGHAPCSVHTTTLLPDGSGVVASEYSISAGGTFWIRYWGSPDWEIGNEALQNIDGHSALGLSFDQSDPPVLYIGYTFRAVLWTDDLGETIDYFPWGLPDTITRVVTADPQIPERVIVAVDGGLYLSTSLEGEWEPTGSGMPEGFRVFALIHDLENPNTLYAATGGDGVYVSTDRGASWEQMPLDGLDFVHVSDLAIHPQAPQYLMAACTNNSPNDGGVFRLRIHPFSDVDDAPFTADSQIELAQNMPNPFRGQTSIRFRLSEPGRVRLTILDPAGHRVVTLRDRQHPAGEHLASWSGLDASGQPVPGGIYFYDLETEDGTRRSRRLLLLK